MPKPARALKAIAKQKDVKRKQDDDEDLSEDLSGGEFAVDEAAEREAFDRAMAEVTRKKEGKKRKHRARNDSSDEEDGIELDPREIEIVRQLRAQRGVGLGAGAGSDEDEDKEDEDEESGLSSQAPKRQKHMMNVPAIQQKLDEIALSPELPWVERLSIVNNQAPLPIEDPHDDLKREATFYQRTLRDVKQAIVQMDSLNMNYKRPSDFFAEMVKSDSHMAKIKDSLIFEKKKMEAALERKRQRDIKKYSKQVHSAKVQERAKQKREDLDAIAKWRKDHKKQNGEAGLERAAAATGGAEDDFPLALESDEKEQKRGRTPSKSPAKPNNSKRRAKDKKYGFGGKKSLKKQNDSKSVNDLSTFSVKKNKSSQGFAPDKFQRGKSPNGKSPARRAAKGGARPGKSKRAQSHGQKRK